MQGINKNSDITIVACGIILKIEKENLLKLKNQDMLVRSILNLLEDLRWWP